MLGFTLWYKLTQSISHDYLVASYQYFMIGWVFYDSRLWCQIMEWFLHITHIMCHEFHAGGLFEYMTCFVSCYYKLKVVGQMTDRSQWWIQYYDLLWVIGGGGLIWMSHHGKRRVEIKYKFETFHPRKKIFILLSWYFATNVLYE